MSVSINHQTYYLIAEACAMAGTNRNTLLRWIREGRFIDVKTRDRNGWRLFGTNDVERLKYEVNKMEQIEENNPRQYNRV
jgi:predicted site-specific integrase-resolvase